MAVTDAPAQAPGEEFVPPDGHLVVGVGASAGGVQAMKQFFKAVPPGSGMSFVAILHLSPDHESNLAEVIQASAAIPVTRVRERTRLARDHIYVVSPNQTLALVDGHIEPSPLAGPEERRSPIDMFFRTLAETQRACAVAVVLSGTGADGSSGMKRVKEYGGICIAQDPDEAEYADMPRAAIATGIADSVLPVASMPGKLATYRRQAAVLEVPEEPTRDDEQALIDIFLQLRAQTGHDFAHYKRPTVMRRLERRMNVQEVASLAEYGRYMRENPGEARTLLKDLLISVTNFFRDGDAFEALQRHVIARMLKGKGTGDQVRVWVAGCATGEEAYSIAMLLCESAGEPLSGPALQVFATDIDEAALSRARSGYYNASEVLDVSPERLRRFFVAEGNGYRVRRELREMVLFALHNVTKDPPFSQLDLVSCRNLLIYLNRTAQERVIRVFHFALKPGGYLFLGNTESAEDVANLFVSAYRESHIFQSRQLQAPVLLPQMSGVVPAIPPMAAAPPESPQFRVRERISYQELHHRLLEQYAPPSVIVDAEYEILHISERAGRYLRFAGGDPSQNLLKVVRDELRLELHGALHAAMERRGPAEAVSGPIDVDGVRERVKIVVSPVFSHADTARGLILVVFDKAPEHPGKEAAPQHEDLSQAEPAARRMDEEVLRLKVQLRATIEQHEVQEEELKASNEELHAMNEELRSSGEELETSKEELQSLNEELSTVNQELKIKIDELSQANNDTSNLMNSTDIATVFVDRAGRIKLFTPRARAIFNLIAGDAGRPLLDITHRLRYPELQQDIDRTLDTLMTSEREVQSEGGWFIVRVTPYRTADDRIAGVVLTFTDITERKRAEEARRDSEERIRAVVESVPEYAIVTMDGDGVIKTWNSAARDIFGFAEREILGQRIDLLFLPEDRAAGIPAQEMRLAREEGRASDERWHVRKDGGRIYVSGMMAPLFIAGRLEGYTKVARDLTQRQESQDELLAAHGELEARVARRTGELADANTALRREIAERIHAQEARLGTLRRLVTAQEEERRRISRELHDQLGQDVTAMGLKLAALKRTPGLGDAMRDELGILEDVVRKLDSDVEFLVRELRPTGLDDLGLIEALRDYTANWSRHFGVAATVDAVHGLRLPAETESALYRIAQEALNNVAKHAQATAATVRITAEGALAVLTISDDGAGFHADATQDGKRLGLVGMRERAALIGGNASIRSVPGEGTTVRVEAPRDAP